MPVKPSENEEKYFQEMELKLRLQREAEKQDKLSAEEKKRLQELHYMHCPKCGHNLKTEQFCSVEIDVCPACKGLWLDANELEMIIASSKQSSVFGSFLKVLGGKGK